VLFLLHGGPSQLDIWDLKPEAPAEVRGEFRPIATSVPGLRITEHLPRLADDRRLRQLDEYRQRAYAVLTSATTRRAFDLGAEDGRLRARYGRHPYGQGLLLARRLVEAGVRLITVYWGGRVNSPPPHWDTHFDNNRRLKEELLPPFDQCFSAFLEDLDARGLLASTLVVCMGEFGRTPRFGQRTANDVDQATGRDHWARCYSLVVAGGPAGGGRVLGRSDRIAAYPADDPYTPQDVAATLLRALGINPADGVRDGFGRLVPLSTGRVRATLFGV
jgi:hypothetical protein